jgi:GntR family transcriptional regulator, transcriptional repressor for pyruvate dehydrogenase complex
LAFGRLSSPILARYGDQPKPTKPLIVSMNAKLKQVRNEAAFDRLLDILRERFAAEGSLPPERTIAQQLNVKRHQLRGALEVLRANGEIGPPTSRRGGSGLRREESLIRTTNPIEVIEMRLAIEPSLARLAALRASPLEIARILRAVTTSGDVDTVDLNFHKTIAASTRNSLAAALYALLRQIGTDVRVRLGNGAGGNSQRIVQRDAEHRAVAEAIAARDPDAAEKAMRVHLGAVQRRIVDRLAPGLSVA